MTGRESTTALPALSALVDAADAGLHPWVRAHVPQAVRRAALEEELGFWLHTAAQDMTYATNFEHVAPAIGQPTKAYLERWIGLDGGGHVLVGPRYLGRDPNLPFVGVSASCRPLEPRDRDGLVAIARSHFAPFNPGFVLLTTCDPVGAWPDTGTELRQVVGLLGELRRQSIPPGLSASQRRNTDFYSRYRAIHEAHLARDPVHGRHTRCEAEEDLVSLAEQGLLWDVLVDGEWAGILAAEKDVRRGVQGVTVVELLLDDAHRGLGYGKYLSPLIARGVSLPDDECLMGTIHADNQTSYRSALRAGRVDVGGEIRIPV